MYGIILAICLCLSHDVLTDDEFSGDNVPDLLIEPINVSCLGNKCTFTLTGINLFQDESSVYVFAVEKNNTNVLYQDFVRFISDDIGFYDDVEFVQCQVQVYMSKGCDLQLKKDACNYVLYGFGAAENGERTNVIEAELRQSTVECQKEDLLNSSYHVYIVAAAISAVGLGVSALVTFKLLSRRKKHADGQITNYDKF